MDLQARWISPAARAWLEAGRPARPLHVFERVCNLVDERDQVLSLQMDAIDPGPLSLVVPAVDLGAAAAGGFKGVLSAQDLVRVEGGRLWLAGTTIDWSRAEPWDPVPPWSTLRSAQEIWRRQLGALLGQLEGGAPPGGLAPLLSANGEGQGRGEMMVDWIVEAARPPAARLREALVDWDRKAAGEAAAALAGLGGGLTPSGDDYLVGVMHALWGTLPEEMARERSGTLAAAAAPRTNPLSAAWLRAAARGETSGHWHAVFEALLADGEDRLRDAVHRLLRVGHTSGADALAGFLAAVGDR